MLASEQTHDPVLAGCEETSPGADDQWQYDNCDDPEEHARRAGDFRCFGLGSQTELSHAGNFDLDVIAVEVPGIEIPMAQCQRLVVQVLENGIAGLDAIGFMILGDLNDAYQRAQQLIAGPIAAQAFPPAELGFRILRKLSVWNRCRFEKDKIRRKE